MSETEIPMPGDPEHELPDFLASKACVAIMKKYGPQYPDELIEPQVLEPDYSPPEQTRYGNRLKLITYMGDNNWKVWVFLMPTGEVNYVTVVGPNALFTWQGLCVGYGPMIRKHWAWKPG